MPSIRFLKVDIFSFLGGLNVSEYFPPAGASIRKLLSFGLVFLCVAIGFDLSSGGPAVSQQSLAQEADNNRQDTPQATDSELKGETLGGLEVQKTEFRFTSEGKVFQLVIKGDSSLVEGIPVTLKASLVNESKKSFYGLSLNQSCKCAIVSGIRGKNFIAGEALDFEIKITSPTVPVIQEKIEVLGFSDGSQIGEPSVFATVSVVAVVFPPFEVESHVRKLQNIYPDGKVRYRTPLRPSGKINFDPKDIIFQSDRFALENVEKLSGSFNLVFRLLDGQRELKENEVFLITIPFTLQELPERTWTFTKRLTFVGEALYRVSPSYVELKQEESGAWVGDVIVVDYVTGRSDDEHTFEFDLLVEGDDSVTKSEDRVLVESIPKTKKRIGSEGCFAVRLSVDGKTLKPEEVEGKKLLLRLRPAGSERQDQIDSNSDDDYFFVRAGLIGN